MNMQVVTEEPTEIKQNQETEELVTVRGSDEKREVAETEVEALNNNKVDVDIEPDVKSNDVKLSLCSLSCIFNCFSGNKNETEK